jgi:small subunit ribosomal protein S6
MGIITGRCAVDETSAVFLLPDACEPGANARQSKSKERRYCNVREYEVTVLLRNDIDDEARAQLIARLEGWLTQGDDEATKPVAHHWGKRQLAYPIDKQTEGYYIFFEAHLDPVKVGEIERNMLYVEEILRHMFIRKDE